MEVVHSCCCGLDVHQKSISVCVVIRESGKLQKHQRTCGTDTSALEELADWLEQLQVTHVAMEATGVYWRPVWNVLEGRFELMLVNPQHVKALSGKKYDRRDASHLADLLQHGLLQGSFVPSPEIRQLRDLTRNRARTVQETTRIKNRIHKVLEEANVKLASVAADVFGVSGRLILKHIIDGERDPDKLANLAMGKLRKKYPALLAALRGKANNHHRHMLDKLLRRLDTREAEIGEDEADIKAAIPPFQKAVDAWKQLPGIDDATAWSLVAEMGPDMAPFDTAEQAASWGCLCPGNHESAGKQFSGRTRKGNPWLRSAICQAACNAGRTKDSYFHAQYRRIAARRGPQKALLAVAHSMLVVGYYLIKHNLQYKELGADFFDQRNREYVVRRAVKRLNSLGYEVHLEPIASSETQETATAV